VDGPFDTDVAALRAAWEIAAHDLGIRVTTDEPSLTASEGTRFPLVAIVHDFGGEHGMAVLRAYDPGAAEAARSEGYGSSVLATRYERYDRDRFIDTLNDWQWCGVGKPPSWYTGKPWTT
jgi:hypothetical protein